jgi:hypothetical protein
VSVPSTLRLFWEGFQASDGQIRRAFVLWETKDVALVLSRFEKALCEMGADEHYLQHVRRGDERSRLVDKVYDRFKNILGLDDLPNEPTPEIAAAHIIAQLQNHLGISELTDLRRHYLAEAMRRIE